jgi:heterodisulfide reductase subunit C/nitrate reductase gamma subunit
MIFTLSLYLALAVSGLGLAYKIFSWFRLRVGTDDTAVSLVSRFSSAIRAIIGTLFSSKVFSLLKVFVADVLFQRRIGREGFLRWFAHISIFSGFMVLLLMHALDHYVTTPLFPGYSSTLNPFMFLRDLAGALVLVGLLIVIYRRFIAKVPRLISNIQDHYAIFILALIVISGVLLEGVKIPSYSRFQEMVEEYTIQASEQDIRSLEAYWVDAFGTVSPNLKGPFDSHTLAAGQEIHALNCAQCHSSPKSAFLGYAASRIFRPIALGIDQLHLATILWYIHFLVCFLGLAYLPFSKMFHVFSTPLSLLVNGVTERRFPSSVGITPKQILELDACMHCGTCSTHCRVGIVFEEIHNTNILPSEKIAPLKALAAGKTLTAQQLRTLQDGLYLCSNCYRCTVVCPAGINLQELWFSVREALLARGYPEFLMLSPLSVYRGLMREVIGPTRYEEAADGARKAVTNGVAQARLRDFSLPLEPGDANRLRKISASIQAKTFSHCYRCATCSNACPVVRNYPKPQERLGLLPHQIMHAVGLELWDLVFSAQMLWDCVGCYQCQEHCPEGVCAADVLYELKNLAITRASGILAEQGGGPR